MMLSSWSFVYFNPRPRRCQRHPFHAKWGRETGTTHEDDLSLALFCAAVDSGENTIDLAVFRRQDRVERGGEEREVVMLRGRGKVGGE